MKAYWLKYQEELFDMRSANHSERNKKYRSKVLKKQWRRIIKCLNKE